MTDSTLPTDPRPGTGPDQSLPDQSLPALRRLLRALVAPSVAAVAFAVLAVLLLAATLHIAVDRSAWHLDIPGSFRVAVLSHAVWQTLPFALLIGLIALAGTLRSRLALPLAALAATTLLFLWLTSWSMFWATGQFLDQYSAAFALASPGSMLLHIAQLSLALLVLVPVVALVVGTGTVLAAQLMPVVPIIARAAVLIALVVAVQFAIRTDRTAAQYLLPSELHMQHPESGTAITAGELYGELREQRSDPLAHLRAELRRERMLSEISPNVVVEWRDQSVYAASAPERPLNVVLIVIESLRSDELEAYGSTLSVMPVLDDVASESAVYIDHYAVASHSSYSSVAPVSSQYPLRDERLHVYPDSAAYPRVLIYDLLAAVGYRTAIISSQNERWGGMANFLASDRLDHFFHAETFGGPTYVPENDVGFARFAGQAGRAGKIDDRFTIGEAMRWIGSGDAPFFVYINLQNSHVPYPVPADAPVPFGPRTTSFPIRFNYFPPDSAHVVRGVYRNSLHYVDAQIGRLVEHLRATAQWDNTVFMVMGDHGQAFFEHGFAAHGNELYEELLRTPLIIRAPGLEPGPRRGMAQHVDVAPTVLDLLGMPPHGGFQGVSLLDGTRTFAYATVQTPMANQYSISYGSHKLVVDARRHAAVFRDLTRDPAERRDWSTAEPELAASMRERLETWRAAQLGYYSSPILQADQYAPVLPEPQQFAAWVVSVGLAKE